MTTETLIWVAVVVVVVAAIAAVGYVVLQQQRRNRLRDRFGPEYERLMAESDNRRTAEQELLAREQRHDQLDLKPLSDESRREYTNRWTDVQERFVDAPASAVTEADRLVTAVMGERGYPDDDFEQRLSDLSVGHAATLDHYRQAREISVRAARKEASTEDLRQAMVHYRALFQELLDEGRDDDVRRDDDTRARRNDARPAKHTGMDPTRNDVDPAHVDPRHNDVDATRSSGDVRNLDDARHDGNPPERADDRSAHRDPPGR
ncbi:hypothetical protein ACIBG8_14415 [Nonomuraea sp. NPDC050556]|uniref:hypothetical protein n=1 Tax=Nonomuraea sp. NPDC050556 TaxID=3364369 RepID=UPI00378DCC12